MRLGEVLVRQGLVDAAAVEAGLARQRKHGGGLGANLIAMQLLSVEQLVGVLQDQRDLRTLPQCERTLTQWEQTFGPDHLNTSRARYDVARRLLAAGDPARALTLSRVARAAQEAALGPDHAWTKDTARVMDAARRALDNQP
jgi:hypothetical protein